MHWPKWILDLAPGIIMLGLRVLLLTAISVPALLGTGRWLHAYVLKRYTAQHALVVSRLFLYTGFSLLAFSLAMQLGLKIGPLMGAAGIFGVAIGFASQTSVSHIISGLFLLAERPFVIGDVITTGSTTGVVLSIDLISVKIRTFDNKLVRIPNETIVKSELTNVTHFPVRRVDIPIGVAYREDIGRVREVLMDVAKKEPMCLMEPAPQVIFQTFGDSSLNFLFTVWAVRENWTQLKNAMTEAIKLRFDAEGIEIPFPHLSLYAGSETAPISVQMVNAPEAGGKAEK